MSAKFRLTNTGSEAIRTQHQGIPSLSYVVMPGDSIDLIVDVVPFNVSSAVAAVVAPKPYSVYPEPVVPPRRLDAPEPEPEPAAWARFTPVSTPTPTPEASDAPVTFKAGGGGDFGGGGATGDWGSSGSSSGGGSSGE